MWQWLRLLMEVAKPIRVGKTTDEIAFILYRRPDTVQHTPTVSRAGKRKPRGSGHREGHPAFRWKPLFPDWGRRLK